MNVWYSDNKVSLMKTALDYNTFNDRFADLLDMSRPLKLFVYYNTVTTFLLLPAFLFGL